MNKLNQYSDFILENSSNSFSKAISEEEFWKLYNKNCKVHKKLTKLWKSNIYKGIDDRHNNFMYSDSLIIKKRKSANTLNWSNLLLSNLPSWFEYPKRNKSHICSTTYNRANNYGDLYAIIPFDNVKIGICPAYDLWVSFNFGLSDDNFNINTFNHLIEDFFDKNLPYKKSDDSYENLLINFKEIEQMDFDNIKFDIKNPYTDIIFNEEFLNNFKNKKITFIKYFNEIMSPEKNNFKLIKYNTKFNIDKYNKDIIDGTEVWMEGPCLFVLNTVYCELILPKIKIINEQQT